MWIFYREFIILCLTLNGPTKRSNHNLSISVPCRPTSNAPPLSASSPQLFHSIAWSSSVACLSAGLPIWESPSCRNTFSVLTRSLPWPQTFDTSMVRVYCLWIVSTDPVVKLALCHPGVFIKFNNPVLPVTDKSLFCTYYTIRAKCFDLLLSYHLART